MGTYHSILLATRNTMFFVGMCLGALGLLTAGMMLRMSFLRLAGSKGEGVKISFFERYHTAQLLTSEYAPVIAFLIVGTHLARSSQGSPTSGLDHVLFVSAILARAAFAAAAAFNLKLARMLAATVSYLTLFALAGNLILLSNA